jgi:hypothetical protein
LLLNVNRRPINLVVRAVSSDAALVVNGDAMNVVTPAELEGILLKQFRRFEGCENIEQVTVISRRGGDWIIGTIKRGNTDQTLTRHGAQMLEQRYRNLYAVAQES